MNTFTIDATNNITAFASLEEARAAKIHNAEYFGSGGPRRAVKGKRNKAAELDSVAL
jgi:hypothetical protein